MNEIILTSVYLAKSLPLEKIADFFQLHSPLKWKDSIVLEGEHLEMILKYDAGDQSVYIFDFGAVTFVNLHLQSIKTILNYLESIIGKLDYNLFMNSMEVHRIKRRKNGDCLLWPSDEEWIPYDTHLVPIAAEILAQSIAMEKIEHHLSDLTEDTELLLNHMQRGRLKVQTKKLGMITTEILKFQFDTIKSIHIFDRPHFSDAALLPKLLHDRLVTYYELFDRFHVIETKSDELLNMYHTYMTLSNKNMRHRLYMLQAFLLLLFPVNSIFGEQIARFYHLIYDLLLQALPTI